MQTTPRLYTVEDLLEMEDDFELDRGMLVPVTKPTSRHGRVTSRVVRIVGNFVEANDLGEVYCNDSGFILERGPDTVRGPDVAFLTAEHADAHDENQWYEGGPDLAVEVLSPSNRPGEVQRKVGQYLDAGSRQVWVLNPDSLQVVVYHADGSVDVLREGDVLSGEPLLPGFRCPVADLFRSPKVRRRRS